jgi:hypothetical protein
MDYQLSVRKEAETDITEAFDDYESCRKNLGQDFLLAVETSLNKYSSILCYIKKSIGKSDVFSSTAFPMVFTS